MRRTNSVASTNSWNVGLWNSYSIPELLQALALSCSLVMFVDWRVSNWIDCPWWNVPIDINLTVTTALWMCYAIAELQQHTVLCRPWTLKSFGHSYFFSLPKFIQTALGCQSVLCVRWTLKYSKLLMVWIKKIAILLFRELLSQQHQSNLRLWLCFHGHMNVYNRALN